MPLTVFDTKGIPATRREHIEAAIVSGGKHVTGPHEVAPHLEVGPDRYSDVQRSPDRTE